MSTTSNEVFGEPFELVELTNSINRIPYKEEALGMMFDWNVVRSQTEKVRINSAGGRIQVVPSTPRDGVAPVRTGDKRKATFVEIPGYAERATIMNREVLNVGAGLDGEDKLMAVETLRDERLAEINGDLDVTVEHQRAKALTGLIEDVDGVELADMYQVMGVEQITVDLDFGDTAKDFAIQLEEHKEIAEIAMGGSSGDIDHFKLICGKDVSKKASASKGYREAMSDPLARILSKQDGRKGVVVNDNVEIVHYRRGFLAPDACFLVPVYTGCAQTIYGPSDVEEFLGNILPRYVVTELLKGRRGIEMEAWTFVLNYFQRPEAILKVDVA